jgi:hypothetical protein
MIKYYQNHQHASGIDLYVANDLVIGNSYQNWGHPRMIFGSKGWSGVSPVSEDNYIFFC